MNLFKYFHKDKIIAVKKHSSRKVIRVDICECGSGLADHLYDAAHNNRVCEGCNGFRRVPDEDLCYWCGRREAKYEKLCSECVSDHFP